ncbi:Phage tail tube protein, GTA-gp10 [Phyllobacterium sp. YR620]|uniref:GTA-gp10 family protein n=1 Tax=Phyllobacterium sp. YR620 TaxID=1881066 RepID=UPI000890C6C2|nr:GTA-gp10 family protein [Phyllobacterium sp. YR620]SDP92508.1 Phage tail tube protein, GTA-gp10 [Phyllobacterium sp. YR620]
MANPHRGQVAFKAGDSEYTLSFSINATCELEDHFDLPIGKVAEKLQKNPAEVRMSDLRAFIWAALRDNHPEVDMIEAGRIATEAGVKPVITAITQCFIAAFPPAEAAKKPDPRRAAKA